MFEEVFSKLFFVLTIAVVLMAFKLRELYREKKMKKLISWIAINNSPVTSLYGHDAPLWTYISDAQYHLKIKKEYCILEEQDWKLAKEILEKFQLYAVQLYLRGELKIIKSKYEIWGEHYFMFLLQSYLMKHQCDDKFFGYDMHKERISYKEYGRWGGALFDATYALTDFAVVYHKMYYITNIYCKNCKSIIESNMALFIDEKNTEKILDTRQIEISRI